MTSAFIGGLWRTFKYKYKYTRTYQLYIITTAPAMLPAYVAAYDPVYHTPCVKGGVAGAAPCLSVYWVSVDLVCGLSVSKYLQLFEVTFVL